MKFGLLFLALVIYLAVYSQPSLVQVFPSPEPPGLSIEQLDKSKNLLCFENQKGIVLYDHREDRWTLYGELIDYNQYGTIQKVISFRDGFIVTLQNASVFVFDTIKKVFPHHIEVAYVESSMLFFLADDTINNSGNPAVYHFVGPEKMLFCYDFAKDSLRTKKLSNPLFRILKSEFYEGKFWIYWENPREFGTGLRFSTVDLKGRHNFLYYSWKQHGHFYDAKVFKNQLYLVTDNSLLTTGKGDSLIKLHHIEHYGQALINNDRGKYYIMPPLRGNTKRNTFIERNIIDIADSSRFSINQLGSLISLNKVIFHGDTIHALFERNNMVVKVILNESNTCKKYSITGGIAGEIDQMIEDDTETWFVSGNYGIFRFVKQDSSWYSYLDFLDYYVDSVNRIYHHQITMNNSHVIIPMQNNYGQVMKCLIFDRQKESFSVIDPEQLLEITFNRGDISATDSKQKISSVYQDYEIEDVFASTPSWLTFLFVYDMPLDGLSMYRTSSLFIRSTTHNITSIYYRDDSVRANGIAIKNKNDGSVTTHWFPRRIKNFNGRSLPYSITGNQNMIFVTSKGGSKGAFIYYPEINFVQTKENWYKTFTSPFFAKTIGDYFFISSTKFKLCALNKNTFDVIDLSEYVTQRPWDIVSTGNYYFVPLENKIIYFDQDFKYQGTLHEGMTKFFETNDKVYVYDYKSLKQLVIN